MALGALAQNLDVTVIPVGMNYFHAHKFRSRAVVEFGDPIEISPELVKDFKNGKRRETVGALLGAIYQSLSAVTVSSPDFETLMVCIPFCDPLVFLIKFSRAYPCRTTFILLGKAEVTSFCGHRNQPPSSQRLHPTQRRPTDSDLSKSINQYIQQLRLLGLRDHQVSYARFSILRVLSSLAYRLGLLIVLSIGTLPGLILFLPVFIGTRTISHKKTKEALAESSVKLQGNDVMATWKILVAGTFAPLLYTFYAVLLAYWTSYNRINGHVPRHLPIWAVVVSGYALCAAITFAALRIGEVGMDILKSLRPLVLCLSPTSASSLATLRRQRAELSRDVTELVNALGPDIFPDCDAAKLPQPRQLYRDISPESSLDDLADSEFFSSHTAETV
jgi:glycerol-3-phosphate O-acyltransferase/dihydroxyacetone phosphate acyltransferase